MQYGNFMLQQPSGMMIYYYLYNKNKGIRKDWGIVFEPILHDFIHAFFSNYSYGIPFKETFFLKYSIKKKKRTWKYLFYEITYNDKKTKKYNGFNDNLMRDLINLLPDFQKIVDFLKKNNGNFNIKERSIYKYEYRYRKLAKKLKLKGKSEYYYGLKTILSFETELSNFLVHIGRLNEVLYNYCIIRDSRMYSVQELQVYKKQLGNQLAELKEDNNARVAFELGFEYLKIINFVLRIEDDDYVKFDYSNVDISMFEFDDKKMFEYISHNHIEENKEQHYIIERMRNALMHGNIDLELRRDGEPVFLFIDSHNTRREIIKIPYTKLKLFLKQACLYSGIPSKTKMILFTPKDR